MSFLRLFIIFTLSLACIFVAIITAVDPYERLGINVFNFKTKAVAQSRENKFRMLESSKTQYEAFILGSSAAHRYPTEKVKSLTGLNTYNYAVQHSTPLDFYAITKHIFSKFNPKIILIQIDFAALNENYKIDNRLYNSPLMDYLTYENPKELKLFDNNYFTLNALLDSLHVIHVNLFGKARHIYAKHGNYIFEKITPHKIKIKQDSDPNYLFSHKRLQYLMKIRDLCIKNDIKLILFSAPIAFNHLQRIYNNPRLKTIHKQVMQSLESNFENFTNFQTEEIKKYNHYRYFWDSVHPTKEMSEIILEQLLK